MSQKQHGHPKGLYLLFVTEMWERFSYYGMRALFTLYMINALLFDQAKASQIYGSYTGLVYLTPLIGGYIADRYWGNRRSILVGGLMMAAGQFFMFLSASFYTPKEANLLLMEILMIVGLALLIIGNGFFKPNISTMVGDLYEKTDHRKDSAFTIFYMGINTGAFIAPLICGFVGDTGNPADFKWGFLCACIGMLLGTTVFEVLKNKYIRTPDGKQIGLSPAKDTVHHKHDDAEKELEAEEKASPLRMFCFIFGAVVLFFLFSFNFSGVGGLFAGADWIGAAIFAVSIAMPVFIITDKSLTKTERSRIWVIYIIAFFVIFFWSAFEQAGNALTVFADKQTDRTIFGWTMPASYFQSFNPIFIVTLAPLFALLWQLLGKHGKEPASPVKLPIGLFLLAVGYLVIAWGVKGVSPTAKVSMIWLTIMYLTHTMGELCLSPIGLSMVNKLSPARFASLLMGVWFMSNAAANKFAGILSGCYPYEIDKTTGESIPHATSFLGYQITNLYDFFMLFVVMAGVAAVVLFFLSSTLKKMMKGID